MREFDPQEILMEPRSGLRAECLKEPRKIWEAALRVTSERTSKGPEAARKWALGVFRGIYPNDWPARNWGETAPAICDHSAYALVEREIKRFRKSKGKAA